MHIVCVCVCVCVTVHPLCSQTVQSSVSVLCATEQLIGCLPEVKWAKQVLSLASELQEESLRVIVQNLPRVVRTPAFHSLLRVRPSLRGPSPHQAPLT